MLTAERCESHIAFATASDLLRPLQWRGFPKRICERAFQDRRLYFRDGHNLSGNGRVCAEWNRKRQREAGGCTRDLAHRFYNEQYQIHEGKQDRYVTGSDAAGLVMGYYDTKKLPIYTFLHSPGAPNYVIADSFFQAAFGGSFLNHQWLIAAATPVFDKALDDGSADDLHAVVDANGMPVSTPLYASPLGPSTKDSSALTASCNPPARRPATPTNVVCGDYAVNTIQPFYWPFAPRTAEACRLPPLIHPTIGDRLTDAHIDWAWYSGGWSNANGDVGAPGWTNGDGPRCIDPNANLSVEFPRCPDKLFQFHHQSFNYYSNYAPGTKARADHLRDEEEFIRGSCGSRHDVDPQTDRGTFSS
jgi:acid phosphatase